MACSCEKGCNNFLKIMFLIFDSIFFMLGLLMLGFGIALYVSPSSIFVISKSNAELTTLLDFLAGSTLTGVGIFMIVLGVFVTVLSLIGFVACLRDSRWIFIIYVIIIILILLVEIIIIIMLAGFPNKVKQFASSTLKLTPNFKDDIQIFPNKTMSIPVENAARQWATIQTQLQCCGINGPSDYSNYPVSQRQVYIGELTTQTSLVPLSCCSIFMVGINSIPSEDDLKQCAGVRSLEASFEEINLMGCYDAVQGLLISYWQIPIGIAAATIGLQVVLLVLSIAILCKLSRGK